MNERSDEEHFAQRWLDRLSAFNIFLAGVALVVLVVAFGWLVFGRYVLNVTPTWVEQLALVLVVFITFMGTAAGVHEQYHLGVEFLRDALPSPLRNALIFVRDVALTIFGAIMFVVCVELVQFGWSTNLPMLNIPEGVRTMPAAACGLLIFIFAGARVLRSVVSFWRPAQRRSEG